MNADVMNYKALLEVHIKNENELDAEDIDND